MIMETKWEREKRHADARAKRTAARVVGVALVILGLFLLAMLLRYQLRLIAFGTRAVGQVTAFDKTPRGRLKPVVRVALADGGTIEFRGISMKDPHVAVGDAVPVYYLASEPTFGEIATFRRFWLAVIVSGGLIVATLGGGFWILRAGSGWF